MQATQRIEIEKNLSTNTQLEDDFGDYEGSDFEVLDEGDPLSGYQDDRKDVPNSKTGQGQGDSTLFGDWGDGQELGSEEYDSQNLKQELQKYEATAIAKNTNLSDEEKKSFQAKIEKLIHAIDLKVGDTPGIENEFQTLQQEISKATIYSGSLRHLSADTGIDPADLEAVFKKYGLNEDKLPTPPDSRVAALLNDEIFSDKLGSLKANVATAEKDLKDEIVNQTNTATQLNDQAKLDKKKERNSDDSSYRYLYDAYFHQDDKSKAVVDARQQLATGVSQVLSSLYGKPVKPDESVDHAGCVVLGGASINVMSDSTSGKFKFGKSTDIDWPLVKPVTFGVDNFGEGKTTIPQWMKDSGYPIAVYDELDTKNWIKNNWWNVAILGFVTGGVSWGSVLCDDLSKKGDDYIPTGGVLRNIGVQSTGETPSTEISSNAGSKSDDASEKNKQS